MHFNNQLDYKKNKKTSEKYYTYISRRRKERRTRVIEN